MNKNKTQSGITLIALIITIIVMLILVGVTVSIAINGGLFGMAKEAKEQTEIGTEREVLQEQLLSRVIENGENIGIPLYDKTIDNSSIWDIVVETKTQTTYGTGWYYIKKGTDIGSYGKTKYNWVVNYETGEMVSLKENEYTKMAYGENIGVKEGLIFNLDPAIIEGIDMEELKNGNTEKLGKDIELKNFDWTDKSGLTKKSFNFDGENDYIKIKYDNEQEKQELMKNGFTFEYYGTLDKGKGYLADGTPSDDTVTGIFCYGNGRDDSVQIFRFAYRVGNSKFEWNAGSTSDSSDFSYETNKKNQAYLVKDFKLGSEIYFTVVVDPSKIETRDDGQTYIKQTFYMNGEKMYEGGYNILQWQDFEKHMSELSYFTIGRTWARSTRQLVL